MARRKSLISKIPQDYYTGAFALVFIFFGIVAFIGDTQSIFGFYLYTTLSKAFGTYYVWIFSPVLIALAVFLFKEKNLQFNSYRAFGLLFYYISLTTLVGWFRPDYIAAFNLYPTLENILGRNPALFSFLILFFLSLYILFRFSVVHAAANVAKSAPNLSDLRDSFVNEKQAVKLKKEKYAIAREGKKVLKEEKKVEKESHELEKMLDELKREKEMLAKMKQPKKLQESQKVTIEKKSGFGNLFAGKEEAKKTGGTGEVKVHQFGNWKLPDVTLLTNHGKDILVDENEIRRKEIEIQEKLLQFGIQVSMEGYRVGPTVIQYRLKPREGVKLQKIENLKKDLTLALHAKSIRIQAPIPGLGVVGIEVPNDERQTVGLREIIESPGFGNKKLDIPIAVGKDVNGDLVIGDLTKMPHILVAGQTASGKSVGMNGFLISMLYKFSPSELKMIMVDPKRVELSVYNGIPHLLTPVITNPEKALNALKWSVAEMLRRYDLATKVNARNLKEYNAKVSKQEKLPYIVIVIDELADLMMSGQKKEVEQNIARIAQMARAVGMHLIVATQRPSVDVITGLIKANVPSRIAFTVASQVDSRTVIDKIGAEDLLGR